MSCFMVNQNYLTVSVWTSRTTCYFKHGCLSCGKTKEFRVFGLGGLFWLYWTNPYTFFQCLSKITHLRVFLVWCSVCWLNHLGYNIVRRNKRRCIFSDPGRGHQDDYYQLTLIQLYIKKLALFVFINRLIADFIPPAQHDSILYLWQWRPWSVIKVKANDWNPTSLHLSLLYVWTAAPGHSTDIYEWVQFDTDPRSGGVKLH